MKLISESFQAGQPLPARLAFGQPGSPVQLAPNRNPHLAWSDVPEGTRSFAVICHDSEVPSRGNDVNQAGRTVPWDLPRVDFTHWVLVDVPAEVRSIEEGSHSAGVTARGKPPGPAPVGVQGLNDYTGWFAGDPDMGGDYAGYDGPCPPWNDERVHRYQFTVYALDRESLGLKGAFTRAQALAAMQGHILGQASLGATYAIYADAR